MTEHTPARFEHLKITALHESPWNPRKHFDDASLAELAASIREKGVIEPIVARPNDKGYEIVAGARRFRASKLAGLEKLPAMVRDLSDAEALELSVIENGQRDDVHPLDEAAGYDALRKMNPKHYTVAQIAAKVGKDESYVYRRLKLLALSREIKTAFDANRITIAHAERLARLTPELQAKAFDEVVFRESTLYDERDKVPGAEDLAPLHELDTFIRENSAIKPRDESTQHFLPEVAQAIAAGEEQAAEGQAPAKLLELSEDVFVRVKLGMKPGDKALPLNKNRWTEVKSAKACDHVERGVVVHGGKARVLLCCATKGCPKHFPAAKKKPAAAKRAGAGEKAAPQESSWDRDDRLRKEAQQLWARIWPDVKRALLAHTAKLKISAALLQTIVKESEISSWQLDRVAKDYGVKLSDENLGQALALTCFTGWDRREDVQAARAAKVFRFDLAPFDAQLKAIKDADKLKAQEAAAAKKKAEKKAAPAKKPAAAKPKAAKKAKRS